MSESILIVSYTFPPSSGIGGRRWAKFSKYLYRSNNAVFVIHAKNHIDLAGNWNDDIQEFKKNICSISSNYPEALGIMPKTFLQKIKYRLSLVYVKIFSKGNYYDKSNFWKKELLNKCRTLIKKNNIQHLICTIGPFKSSYYLLELKKDFPHLKFVVDYRDPWTSNKTSFGYDTLSPKRLDYEINLERIVLKMYDQIWVVSKEMAAYFKVLVPEIALNNKIKVLPNGFDYEDLSRTYESDVLLDQSKINIVFAGTFYDKSIHVFNELATFLIKAREKDGRFEKIKFTFIGSIPAGIAVFFEKNKDIFTFLGKKKLATTYSIIKQSSFCALFLTDDLNYSFSTKFYEYMALNKPIISFSKVNGENAKFIKEKSIGIGIDFNSMEHEIEKIVNGDYDHFIYNFSTQFDASQYSVKELSEKLEDYLKE